MGNKNHYKIILSVTYIGMFLIFFMLIIIPLILIIYIDANVVLVLVYIIASILLACSIWRILNEWIKWNVWEKCDFESYRIYQEKVIKMKKNSNKIKLHLSLLNSYLILGYYDQCKRELDETSKLYTQMSDIQKLNYHFLYIDYLAAFTGYSSLEKEIEQLLEVLNGLEKIGNKEKNRAQKSIALRKYLAEKKWKEAVGILNISKTGTVFDEVNRAYVLGMCYYKMEEYEQALQEFGFVSKWGGNTKYVALANDIIKKLYEKEQNVKLQEKKTYNYNIGKIRIFGNLLIACFIVTITILINYHSMYGRSIEETYSRRYLCKESEVSILYQENIGNYEMVILSEDDKIAYCLFKKIFQASGFKYKIINSFCTNKYLDNHESELERIEMIFSESEKEQSEKFYQESEIEQEVWTVINRFYKKNNIFDQEDFMCIGISFYPAVENVTINGQYVVVEQINIENKETVYLWKMENLDLRTNLQIDYIEK